jgi:hypothetical protein
MHERGGIRLIVMENQLLDVGDSMTPLMSDATPQWSNALSRRESEYRQSKSWIAGESPNGMVTASDRRRR